MRVALAAAEESKNKRKQNIFFKSTAKKIEASPHPTNKSPKRKETMSCSICLNDITRETGVATLSCNHSFHISCIAKWSSTPESSTCPMCRKRLGETESMAALPSIAEGEEDEEEEQEVVISRYSLEALLRMFGASAESSNLIDIMFPGQDPISLSRMQMNALAVGRAEPIDLTLWNRTIFLFGVGIVEEDEDEYEVEDEAEDEAEDADAQEEPVAVTWRCLADGSWASGPVINPEDETGVSATASGWAEPLPVSAERVEQVAQEAATKMQGAWWSFRSRVL